MAPASAITGGTLLGMIRCGLRGSRHLLDEAAPHVNVGEAMADVRRSGKAGLLVHVHGRGRDRLPLIELSRGLLPRHGRRGFSGVGRRVGLVWAWWACWGGVEATPGSTCSLARAAARQYPNTGVQPACRVHFTRAKPTLDEFEMNKRARVSLTLRLICGYLLRSSLPF